MTTKTKVGLMVLLGWILFILLAVDIHHTQKPEPISFPPMDLTMDELD